MSSTQMQPGGSPTPSLATVATDQQTIFGAGTPQDPLTTNGSGGSSGRTFRATLETVGSDHIGQPMCISSGVPSVGIVAVTKANGTTTEAAATCCGLMIANDGTGVTIQYDGIVTLTEAQWDAFCGTTGGLAAPDSYYLDASGHLANVPPGSSGDFSSRVFVVLNSTQVLLTTPSLPIVNP